MFFLRQTRNTDSQIQAIDVNTYKTDFVDTNTDHIILDVRTTAEFMRGHAQNAINIPLHELAQRTNELPQDQPIMVICASGNRSLSGVAHLVQEGYSDVYNFNGGTFAWMSSGLPME